MAIQFLEDLTDAIEQYPHEYLTIEIVNVSYPGRTINRQDDVSWYFQVSNRGPLVARELSFLIEGLNGTEVKGSGAVAQWVSSWTTSTPWFPDVPAHSGDTPVLMPGNAFHFKPTQASQSPTELVRISVAGWNTDFAHPFVSHSRADAQAAAVFSSQVART